MWLKTLNEWKAAGTPCAIVTIIRTDGSTPRGVGSKMIVNIDGKIAGSVGGGPVEQISRLEAQKAIQEQKCINLDFSLKGDVWQVTPDKTIEGMCGGSLSVFIEPVLSEPEVVVFGGGHIGFNIAKLCEILEMPFRVFDNREEYSSVERFPLAKEHICKPYESLSESIALMNTSYCVILTHGHKFDEVCLEQLLRNKAIPYIGMIGSPHKIQVCIDNIRSRGGVIDDRLYSPVGLKIANNLPGQIALAIVAQIILLINNGSPEHFHIAWHEQEAR